MARIHELIRHIAATNPHLAADVEREVDALAGRRAFGLNFERHTPEEVELPGRPVRRGDKVHVLPPRGQLPKAENAVMWRVISAADGVATIVRHPSTEDVEATTAALDDLVVVAEFRDPIYPGLVSTGKVERGGDKPFHTVINAENFHALQTLLFTHRGKVDALYIDPPYNTGARDWKYNNDYVEADDLYRHSKWLAFMERRLLLAKELLNPEDSVLIVTIDEKEYLRLGILLEQTFPEAHIQMVTSVISSQASVRSGAFSRCDEYLFFVMLGNAGPRASDDDMLNEGQSVTKSQLWFQYVRTGNQNLRQDRPAMFFPLFADPATGRIVEVGIPIPLGVDKSTVVPPAGLVAVWPETADGQEGRWRTGPETARERAASGLLRLAKTTRRGSGFSAMTVNEGTKVRIAAGEVIVDGYGEDGSAKLREISGGGLRQPKTVWNKTSHNAGWHGSKLLAAFLPGRAFPFPKSLYAVEDALRLFIGDKPNAIVVDFFAGSGTTAHAVMRLNRQDGGHRRSICVTNNEVGAAEQVTLRARGLRPGDEEWEPFGICDYITKPRIEAAITGTTTTGQPVKGEYKFSDVFPMAHGFEENVEFFTLTYEAPLRVQANRDFERIAPLLWSRAGSRGRRIETIPYAGWDVADAYGVLVDLDHVNEFVEAVRAAPGLTGAFIVTDDERLFQAVVRDLPDSVEPVRLYEAYLSNFRIDATRSVQR